jgi:hypothetical protein
MNSVEYTRGREREPGSPPYSDSNFITFKCPACGFFHTATRGDFENGELHDFECPDNDTSHSRVAQDFPNDDLLFPTDGTKVNPMDANPYSTRKDAYPNFPITITGIASRNSKDRRERNIRNF